MTSDDPHREAIAEGLAAWATTLAEMAAPEAVMDAKLEEVWRSLGAPQGSFAEAAASIATQPQPLNESAAERERTSAIREMFQVASPESQLLAMLAGREALERLAARFG